VAVCASLAGSALGVQLAAALLGQMPLAALRERLARRTTGPDAAAVDASSNVLRSALSWSHELLSPAAQRVFRCLAVAQGPLPLALVRALACVGDEGVGDESAGEEGKPDMDPDEADEFDAALADLVDRSLVQCEAAADDVPRYRLLEAPRALALERLQEAGEHASSPLWLLAQALGRLGDVLHTQSGPGQNGPAHEAAARRQLPSTVDIVATFEAALVQRSASAAATTVRLVEVLLRGGVLMRHAADRLRWAAALRGLAEDAGLTPELRARALEGTSTLMRHSDPAASRIDLERAAAAWHQAGDSVGEFRALARATNAAALAGHHADAAALLARVRMLDDLSWPPGQRRWRWFAEGVVAVSAGDLPCAIAAWRQQLALMQGWDAERVQALLSLANAEQIGGDAATALPRLLESIAIARRIHMRATLYSFLLPNLVAAQLALGDLASARGTAAEGWLHARAQDAEAWWADHLALLAAREGRPRTAARLLGLADGGYERLKDARQALEVQSASAAEAAARKALGDVAFDAMQAEGRTAAAADRVVADALAADDGATSFGAG